MHAKITMLIINFVATFDQNGVTASMFGLEQRKNVVSAAMMEPIVTVDPIETSIGKSARSSNIINQHDRVT